MGVGGKGVGEKIGILIFGSVSRVLFEYKTQTEQHIQAPKAYLYTHTFRRIYSIGGGGEGCVAFSIYVYRSTGQKDTLKVFKFYIKFNY